MKYKMLELGASLLDTELLNMFQEIPKTDEFGQTNEYYGKTQKEIVDKINLRVRVAYSLVKSRNVLPAENYILYVNDKPVCIGGLRLKLNNYWKRHGGNIWYKTRPSKRKKGYATKFVELLCERVKELGLKEVLAQCNIKNIASNKVLSNNKFKLYENVLCKGWDDTNFYKKFLY